MKLTSTQLKQIIREETAKVIAKKKINEDPAEARDYVKPEFRNLIASYEESWISMDNGTDPSIEQSGTEAWEYQVDLAINELTDRINEVIDEVETGLINGDYAQ